MKIDYISDLHLDFYVRHNGNEIKYKRNTVEFLETLLPDELGEVLVIAGDISHYNRQSYIALEYFSQVYERVFFVTGNHDYYLISSEQSKKYKNKSIEREFELDRMIESFSNVTRLFDYDVTEYEGVKFAGSTNWYPLTEFKDVNFFNSISNDSNLIKHMSISQCNYFESLCYDDLDEVDVIVTHVPPIIIDSHHKHGSTSCYLNELKELNAKHYVFGHCHEQNIYEKVDSKFYINALGYPNEWTHQMNPMDYEREKRIEFMKQWNKIKSFEVNN